MLFWQYPRLAGQIRRPAEFCQAVWICIWLNKRPTNRVAPKVSGATPETTGQRPVLPKTFSTAAPAVLI